MPIPTYIINLKKRTDRKENVLKEFVGRDEFKVHIVEAIEHQRGATGLWLTIRDILAGSTEAFILICEDDHQFTENYSKEYLAEAIREAAERGADVLSGGISWLDDGFPVSESLFWIRKFSGLQFTILFRKCFDTILNANFGPKDAADAWIAEHTKHKFVLYPFCSTQRDYGYSDATPVNNQSGLVEKYFNKSDELLGRLKHVSSFYTGTSAITGDDYLGITLPVYVISQRGDGRSIREQFLGKTEFHISDEETPARGSSAPRQAPGSEELPRWHGICNAVRKAIDADDDVIIICDDDHIFPEDYSAEYLLKNIIEAHSQGAGILLGAVTRFSHAMPITENRFWVNSFWRAPFMVLYSKIFQPILDEPFDETTFVDDVLSEITSNKLVLFPFISSNKDFDVPCKRFGELQQAFMDFS